MIAVPAATPVTTPVDEWIVATEVALLLHATVPEVAVGLDKVVELPVNNAVVPVMLPPDGGEGLTVSMMLPLVAVAEVTQPAELVSTHFIVSLFAGVYV